MEDFLNYNELDGKKLHEEIFARRSLKTLKKYRNLRERTTIHDLSWHPDFADKLAAVYTP